MAAKKKKEPEEKDAGTLQSTRSMQDISEKKPARTKKISTDLKGQTSEEHIHELRAHQIELEMQAEELQRIQHELEKSRYKYINLYEFAPVGYLTLTDKARITEVNLTGAALLGVERKALTNHGFGQFIKPENLLQWDRFFMNVRRKEGKQVCNLMLKRSDGSTFPSRLTGGMLNDGDGDAGILIAFSDITDISEQKRAQEALRESEEKFRSLVEHALEGILILDLQGTILFANNAAARTIEADDCAGLIGRNVMEFIAPESREDVVKDFIQVSQGHDAYLAQYNAISAKGNKFCVESIGKVISYEGKPADLISIRDITEQKDAEEALRKSEEKFRNVFDWANDAIMLHTLTVEGSTGRFIDANRVACRMLGYTRDELFTMGPPDIVPAEHHPLLGEIIRQAAIKESVLFETRFLRKDGTTFPVESSSHLVSYEGKRIWVSHIRDITERKQAEELRERLIHELAQKNTELERFTYTVSHDLKSPLITIQGFLHLLENDARAGDADRLHEDITRIHAAAKKMEDFIAALLKLSRIGRIVSPPVNVSLASLVHDAAEQLDTQIRERGVTLIIPDNLPEVYGDRMRLLQVFTNLLENAVKFMGDQNEPKVEISVCHKEGEEMICIRDNGIGIAPEDREKIFSVFTQLNPGIAGTGIGLALVKRIVDVHGGRCWVESEGKGKGSTFCFTLPEAHKTPQAGAGEGR